ncbi:histidine phosphatase family protein [Caulobacter sp. BP25]|uniref:histidine phosphatase family protein n=1 Tax=Caulobacter sp. BP25 TaxID=2048900 RepID=UPI000C12C363|nr:histidine phosphatase family protein [Caulobacter sp. BP25]PHY21386.1 phosphoglycerate kinase [Caulobacter sp. BP25]
MSGIHVIRHGRPASTWGGADDDPGLDATGLEQARAVAREIMGLSAAFRPSRVVSSPLRRCKETAAPLAEALGVEIEIDPRVGEIPTPRALTATERPDWLRKAFSGRWTEIAGDLDYAAWARGVTSAILDHDGAAVFSHFVALNAAVATATERDEVVVFRPDHCSRTLFRAEGGRLILIEKGREAQSQVL